jgi:hypothetical protein
LVITTPVADVDPGVVAVVLFAADEAAAATEERLGKASDVVAEPAEKTVEESNESVRKLDTQKEPPTELLENFIICTSNFSCQVQICSPPLPDSSRSKG